MLPPSVFALYLAHFGRALEGMSNSSGGGGGLRREAESDMWLARLVALCIYKL